MLLVALLRQLTPGKTNGKRPPFWRWHDATEGEALRKASSWSPPIIAGSVISLAIETKRHSKPSRAAPALSCPAHTLPAVLLSNSLSVPTFFTTVTHSFDFFDHRALRSSQLPVSFIMRSSTIFAAFAAVLMSGAAAAPVRAPAAVAEIQEREPQLLGSLLGTRLPLCGKRGGD